jgi:hypothetical protein
MTCNNGDWIPECAGFKHFKTELKTNTHTLSTQYNVIYYKEQKKNKLK